MTSLYYFYVCMKTSMRYQVIIHVIGRASNGLEEKMETEIIIAMTIGQIMVNV